MGPADGAAGAIRMDAAALHDFLERDFPQVADRFRVTAVAPMALSVVMHPADSDLRPGGTVSGPSLFALADVGVYLAVLSMIGPVALAVTTTCAIDFMRKPRPGRALTAEVRLLKLGRVLAVGDALIRSAGDPAVVARASVTYSIPPQR